jgi:pantoate--beta-alanine ligase
LSKYPRTLESDIAKIIGLSPDIILYAPSVDDIYDGKVLSQPFDFDGLEWKEKIQTRPL